MTSLNVLIVDDDREASHRLADILAAIGHTTRIAAPGAEGLREMESDPPDVLLLGVDQPLLDGPELAEALVVRRAGKTAIPIVLMSASRDLERIAGIVGTPYFLRKPFAISQAIKMVKHARQAPAS